MLPISRHHRRPYFTDDQYQWSDEITANVSATGFSLGVVLLILWMRKPKRQYLITTFIVLSLLLSLTFLVTSLNTAVSMEEKFCRNNAVALNSTDGTSLCVAQGAFMVFLSAALNFSWLAQTIDLYLTIVCGMKGTLKRYANYYMSLIFVYPLILVIAFSGLGYLGYNGNGSYCVLVWKPGTSSVVSLAIYYIPIIFIMLLGTLLFIQVLYQLLTIWWFGSAFRRFRPSSSVADSSTMLNQVTAAGQLPVHAASDSGNVVPNQTLLSIVPVLGTNTRTGETDESSLRMQRAKGVELTVSIVAYCLLFLILWSYLLAYRIQAYMDVGVATRSYDKWVTCMVSHHDGESDVSWQKICGVQPEYYKHWYEEWYIPDLAFITGQTLIVCLVFYREFVIACCNWMFRDKKVVAEIDREVRRIMEIRHSRIRRNEERRAQERRENENRDVNRNNPVVVQIR
jgi:hypothetical protein